MKSSIEQYTLMAMECDDFLDRVGDMSQIIAINNLHYTKSSINRDIFTESFSSSVFCIVKS